MKTDIWHLPDERPENNTMIIYPVGDVVMGGHIYDYTDWDLMKRNIKHWWMYQNDFLKTKEQSSKIERLEKEISGIENKIKHAKSWLSLYSNLSESDIDDLL
jgi:hypothetical protein